MWDGSTFTSARFQNAIQITFPNNFEVIVNAFDLIPKWYGKPNALSSVQFVANEESKGPQIDLQNTIMYFGQFPFCMVVSEGYLLSTNV